MMDELKPCPFCGGPVKLEETRFPLAGKRRWGVVCRNGLNLGGTCAIEQIPSASEEAAITRWNTRAPAAEPVQVPDAFMQGLAKTAWAAWDAKVASWRTMLEGCYDDDTPITITSGDLSEFLSYISAAREPVLARQGWVEAVDELEQSIAIHDGHHVDYVEIPLGTAKQLHAALQHAAAMERAGPSEAEA